MQGWHKSQKSLARRRRTSQQTSPSFPMRQRNQRVFLAVCQSERWSPAFKTSNSFLRRWTAILRLQKLQNWITRRRLRNWVTQRRKRLSRVPRKRRRQKSRTTVRIGKDWGVPWWAGGISCESQHSWTSQRFRQLRILLRPPWEWRSGTRSLQQDEANWNSADMLASGWRDVQNWKVNCRVEFYKNYRLKLSRCAEEEERNAYAILRNRIKASQDSKRNVLSSIGALHDHVHHHLRHPAHHAEERHEDQVDGRIPGCVTQEVHECPAS